MKEQRIPKLWENLNATWGGETGLGLIEDPNVAKEVGKMYIGSDGKAYICLNPSNINNSENYMPCNVVDTTTKLNNINSDVYGIIYCGRHMDSKQVRLPKKYNNYTFLLSHGGTFNDLKYIYEPTITVSNPMPGIPKVYTLDVSYCGLRPTPGRNLYIRAAALPTSGGVASIPGAAETILIYVSEDEHYQNYVLLGGGGHTDNFLLIIGN